MKYIILGFVFLAFSRCSIASEIPAIVKASFTKAYPTVKNVKWNKENENYEASFDLNEDDCSVLFDAQGNIIETEIEIEASKLPKGVLEYIKEHYKKSIREISKITDAKGIITYEVEIKGKDILFNSEGSFIKEIPN